MARSRKQMFKEVFGIAEDVPGVHPRGGRVVIVDANPREDDGSADAWRGYMQLKRQRRAVELSNPDVLRRMIEQSLTGH